MCCQFFPLAKYGFRARTPISFFTPSASDRTWGCVIYIKMKIFTKKFLQSETTASGDEFRTFRIEKSLCLASCPFMPPYFNRPEVRQISIDSVKISPTKTPKFFVRKF